MKFYSLEIRKIASHTLFPFQALNYLGIQPTKEQHQALRQQMQVDPKGMVSFGGNVRFITLHHHRNLVKELLWPTFIECLFFRRKERKTKATSINMSSSLNGGTSLVAQR